MKLFKAFIFSGLIFASTMSAQAQSNQFAFLRSPMECELMVHNWFLTTLGFALQKNVYTHEVTQGMIEEIQRSLLILSIDALRKAGLASPGPDQKGFDTYTKYYKHLLSSDTDLETYMGSSQEKDWAQYQSSLKQLNEVLTSRDPSKTTDPGKLTPANLHVLDRTAISSIWMDYFFIGALSNCYKKGIYGPDAIQGILEQLQGLMTQVNRDMELAVKSLTGPEQKQVLYYQTCLANLQEMTVKLGNYSTTGTPKDWDSFRETQDRIQKMIVVFATDYKKK